MRNIGGKLFPSGESFYHKIKKNTDFIEIMAVEGKKYAFLKNDNKPIIIHMEHDSFGINFANPNKKQKNIKAVQWAVRLANKFHAKKIIIHTGHIEHNKCTIQEIIRQLRPIWDSRMIFENLIYIGHKQYMYNYNAKQLKYLTNLFKTGICLDISHAVITAEELKQKPETILKELCTLPIYHIHVCDGFLEIPEDKHLHIGEGNFPLKQYLKLLPKNIDVTLETGKNPKKWKNDAQFVKKYGN
ncbi:MAG: TIM barrel protein [Candidatus Woesearchaeota archaeon]|jgi:sugar phosphate isomerase/epimerase